MHRSIKLKRLKVNDTHGPAIGAANAGATREATRKRVEWRMMMINLKWKLVGQKGLERRRRTRKRNERKKKAVGTDPVRRD
jgi:hypothetical protein